MGRVPAVHKNEKLLPKLFEPPPFQLVVFDRRLILTVFTLSLTVLSSCAPRPVSRQQAEVFDSFSEIIVVARDQTEREKTLRDAFRLLQDLDEKWNLSKTQSEMVRLNEKGFEAPQEVSGETLEVIQKSQEFFERSGGAFDITVRPLKELWGFYDRKYRLPEPAQIQAVLNQVGMNHLRIDPQKRRVGFAVSGMGLDLNGIKKGYACDKTVEFLKKRGVQGALVNIGGAIRAFGNSPDGRPWRVGIAHPRDPTRTLRVVTLLNEALSTAGDYEQFFVVNGRRYPHILNPRTGYPANQTVAVSVIAPSALIAEALATTLFVMGPDKGPVVASQFPPTRWYLTYFTDGDLFKTLSSEPSA